MKMVVTLALILTFSPGEKEQRSHLSGFADDRPTNPVAGFRVTRQVILPLPGGEGRGEGECGTFFNATGRAETRPVALESDSSRRNRMKADAPEHLHHHIAA
jgi:hypothetical protein